jgi:hypothetical protein
MSSEDVIRTLAEALRDVIDAVDESYLRVNPEDAYMDLACQLIFKMKTVTVVPVATENRTEIGKSAVRIFEILDRWLRERPAGVRSLETAVNASGRTEITLSELVKRDDDTVNEVRGFFQGESVRDAYAQGAQTIEFNGGDLED